MGGVENGQPAILSDLPDMPGSASPWRVLQWIQQSFISPRDLTLDDPATLDPSLGLAAYAFTAPDRHAHVRIYRNGPSWTYELYQRGGTLRPGGATNLFLSAPCDETGLTFADTIVLELDARLSAATVRYDTPDAERTAGVLGQVFTGLGLMFTDPATGQRQSVFMQLRLSASRPMSREASTFCSMQDGRPNLLYNPAYLSDEIILPFRPDPGPPSRCRYVLSDYVRRLVATGYVCGDRRIEWSPAARDVRNWRLSGLYVGLETNTVDTRPGASTASEQGFIEVALQIHELRVISVTPA